MSYLCVSYEGQISLDQLKHYMKSVTILCVEEAR